MRIPNLPVAVLLLTQFTARTNAQIFQSVGQVMAASSIHQPVLLRSGDFNRDGWPDFATNVGGWARVWFSDGAGGFTDSLFGIPGPTVEFGDLNGDGKLDLVSGGSSALQVLLGDGGTQFAQPATYTVAQNVILLELADFDHDGMLDVATLHHPGATVSVLLNDGTGALLAPVPYQVLPDSPFGLGAADIDGDQDTDIVTCSSSNEFGLLMNDGTGAFHAVAARPGPPAGFPQGFLLADMNHDLTADIVWWHNVFFPGMFGVGVMLNDGNANFSPAGFHQITDLRDPAVVGDFNGDGHPDVAIARWLLGTGGILVLYGDGQGNLVPEFVDTQQQTRTVAAADFDLDGKLDLFALAYQLVADRYVMFMHNTSLQPSGLSGYGHGTRGCAGEIVLSANSVPNVGNATFALLSANAPGDSMGLVLLGTASDPNGSDPFGIGAILHLALTGEILTQCFFSGPGGVGYVATPIPQGAALAGSTFYLQGLWLETTPGHVCTASHHGVVSSHGLSLTIQP